MAGGSEPALSFTRVFLNVFWKYLLRSETKSELFFPLLHFSNKIACPQQLCNEVATKKEASLRKRLKFTVLLSKPDEYGLSMCTVYFRTEEVPLRKVEEKPSITIHYSLAQYTQRKSENFLHATNFL